MDGRGKTLRLVLGLAGALAAVAAAAALLAWAFRTRGAHAPADQVLLPFLSFAVVVLALGLAGVLIRNLVRLLVERKRGLLGSRLRTKLVFFFLALVLLPATVLFYGSAQVINETVEAILRTPMENLARQARATVDQWNDYFRDLARQRAAAVAADLDAGVDPLEAADRWTGSGERSAVRVSRGRRVLTRSGDLLGGLDPPVAAELDALLARRVEAALGSGAPATGIEHFAGGLLVVAVTPTGAPAGAEATVVAFALEMPAGISNRLGGIDAAERAYRRFRAQRRELVRFYLTLVGLIFLVTLFVATWIGFYVTRRITGPLQQLAAASREISSGNLAVRVDAVVGDELGVLVDAFNEMAAELQENRAVITRSTADLRRSNRALDGRRRYIETLLSNLSTGVVSLDPAGRVTTVNPAVRRILGVELGVDDDARTTFAAAGLEPLVDLLAAAPPPEGLRREVALTRGGARTVAVQITPLSRGSEDLGRLVMVEDLTELLRAQRAATWREIARRIAHEIKNPLTPIQLSAQRLRKKFREGAADLGPVLLESTASIEREVGALEGLVDEFSRFARLPELSVRRVDFGSVVESVVALYRGQPEVEWVVELQPDLAPVVLDPEQIRRVLMNLIDNALAAMEQRGRITIRAHRAADGALRIELSDTGPGIRPEDRDKMFAPYFSTKERGTGLGLAIVHKIVTDHRGTIRVEDGEGGGARFVIELPREARSEVACPDNAS